MKVQSVIAPSVPFQKTAPPLVSAELLLKLQLVKVPLAPDQKIAPPRPVWKLKFQKYKTMLLIG